MHISQARPAQKFYRIPMAVHRVILAGEVGRGEVVTLLKLAAYLWSEEPVEGSRAEFAEALCIEAQTFEAHVPALGRAGVLSYTQPHVGVYRLNGLVSDDNESAALQAAWKQAEQEWPAPGVAARNRYVWQSQRAAALKLTLPKTGEASKLTLDEAETPLQASKLTLPVVVDPLHPLVLEVIGDSAQQASKLTLDAEKLTLDPQASKVTLDPGFAALLALYEQEIGGTITAMLADEFRELWAECSDIARWRTAFKASIGAKNRWKYARAIILNPERKPTREEQSNGRNAGNRRVVTQADAPSGASADIAAWYEQR